jgi:hypothetical protein
VIDCLLDKNINHVSFDPKSQLPIFSSLYNKNKEDDKIYLYRRKENKIEEIIVDIIPSDCRIINIFSSGGKATLIHLGFIIFIIIINFLFLFLFYYFYVFYF